jgi:hypothetical protein
MIKFRPQRGSFKEAMSEVVEVKDGAALLAHLQKLYAPKRITSFVLAAYYYDARNGWETYLVTIPEEGVVLGYTDGPI